MRLCLMLMTAGRWCQLNPSLHLFLLLFLLFFNPFPPFYRSIPPTSPMEPPPSPSILSCLSPLYYSPPFPFFACHPDIPSTFPSTLFYTLLHLLVPVPSPASIPRSPFCASSSSPAYLCSLRDPIVPPLHSWSSSRSCPFSLSSSTVPPSALLPLPLPLFIFVLFILLLFLFCTQPPTIWSPSRLSLLSCYSSFLLLLLHLFLFLLALVPAPCCADVRMSLVVIRASCQRDVRQQQPPRDQSTRLPQIIVSCRSLDNQYNRPPHPPTHKHTYRPTIYT